MNGNVFEFQYMYVCLCARARAFVYAVSSNGLFYLGTNTWQKLYALKNIRN